MSVPIFLQKLPQLESKRREVLVQKFRNIVESVRLARKIAAGEERASEYKVSEAIKEINREKNRYLDVIPFDKTRVILSPTPRAEVGGYINASHIRFENEGKWFIAAQGPLPHTIEDFWRACWEQGVTEIVMLTPINEGNRKKCERYWPEEGEWRFAHSQLLLKIRPSEDILSSTSIITRHFELSQGDEEPRMISQYHYIAWPDHGVPDDPSDLLTLVDFINAKNADTANSAKDNKPLLVHCSAGIGRTGVYCTLDVCTTLLKSDKKHWETEQDLIEWTVRKLRSCRAGMVQMPIQYAFIYDALSIWCLKNNVYSPA